MILIVSFICASAAGSVMGMRERFTDEPLIAKRSLVLAVALGWAAMNAAYLWIAG